MLKNEWFFLNSHFNFIYYKITNDIKSLEAANRFIIRDAKWYKNKSMKLEFLEEPIPKAIVEEWEKVK